MGKQRVEGEEDMSTEGTATSTFASTATTTTATETTTTASSTTSVASASASSATVTTVCSMPSTSTVTASSVTASSVNETSSSASASTESPSSHTVEVSMATMLEKVTSRVCSSSYPALAAEKPTSTPAAPGSGSPEDQPEGGARGQGATGQGALPEEARQRAHPGRQEPRSGRAGGEARRVSRARSPQAPATSQPRSPPTASSGTLACSTSPSTHAPALARSSSPVAAGTPFPVSLSPPPLASSTPFLASEYSTHYLERVAAFASTPTFSTPCDDFFRQRLLELQFGKSVIPFRALTVALARSLGFTVENPESDARAMDDTEDIVKPIVRDGQVILEVECGQNKGLLYLSKLCQGSKGSCIYSDGAWFAPNEFQYHCGRESAKDWKRSIRHHGKSLKLLLTKNILVVHQTSCECAGCKTPTQMNRTRNGKERKPVGDKARVKRQPSLDHHVNGAFKPVGFPSLLVSPSTSEAKPLPASDVATAKKPTERHCSPLRESTSTNVIEAPRSPKLCTPTDLEDRHMVTSDTENSAASPAKREETKEVKVTAAAPKWEKSGERASLEQLKKQSSSPPKAECARVKGDFRPKTQHGSEARGEKRKSSSESTEERVRDAKVAAVSSASHPDTPHRKSSEQEGRRSASPARPVPRDSEARTSVEESKAKAVSKEREREREERERRERERVWERAVSMSSSMEAHAARDASPATAMPESAAYSSMLSQMARTTGGAPTHFLSSGLMDPYANMRPQDLASVPHSMVSPYLSMGGLASYPGLLASKDFGHSLPIHFPISSALTHGSVPYDPRLTYALSNYPLAEHYRTMGYLAPTVGSFMSPPHSTLLKRLHSDAPDVLDLSTKAMRLDYGSPDYRYDPVAMSAIYSGFQHPAFDYSKYAAMASHGLPKSAAFPDDLAHGSP